MYQGSKERDSTVWLTFFKHVHVCKGYHTFYFKSIYTIISLIFVSIKLHRFSTKSHFQGNFNWFEI